MTTRVWWVLGFLFTGLGTTWVSAAEWTGTPEPAQASRAPYVTPEAVESWREQGRPVTLLDVRAADEFVAGHIANAINVVYDQVASLAHQLPHDEPIVVYCIHSTHRAPEAVKSLRHLGFDNAFVLEGGIVAWQAAGLTIRASDVARLPTILPLTKRCAELGATATTEIR